MTHHLRTRSHDQGGEDILECAISLFAERGYEHVSFADIAERSGEAEARVRRLFPTKAVMMEQLVELSSAQIADAVSRLVQAAAKRDPESGLRAVFVLLFTTIVDKDLSAATRVVMAEGARVPSLARHYRLRVIDVAHEALAELVAVGVAQGQFRPVDLNAANRLLIGPAVTQLLMSTVFADPGASEMDPAALADSIADILFNGLKA